MSTRTQWIFNALTPLLADVGFKKREARIFTIQLSSQVLGWLGLNTGQAPGAVAINPVIGVHHQEVERLVAELRGEKVHSYLPATLSKPLGYLLPAQRFEQWFFTPDAASEVAADMVTAIATYGLPLMKSFTTLDELRRGLEPSARLSLDYLAVYRRPVVWLLMNEPARAAEELDQALAVYGDRTEPAVAEYRRFAAALRARLPT